LVGVGAARNISTNHWRFPMSTLAEHLARAAAGRLDDTAAAALAGGLDPGRFEVDGEVDGALVDGFVAAVAALVGGTKPGDARERGRAEARRRYGEPTGAA
jgi:hypothetical protein